MDAIAVPRHGPAARSGCWPTRRTRHGRSATGCVAAVSARRSRNRPTSRRIAAAAAPAGGRPPTFDKQAYRQRNVAERCLNRLIQWRGLTMGTDRLALHYQAALTLAGILLWTKP